MKAPNSFTLRPDFGGKPSKRELVSWRVAKGEGQVSLILYKLKKQFSITIPLEEAGGLADKLLEAASALEVEPSVDAKGFYKKKG